MVEDATRDPKHTTSSVKPVGSNVMTWPCMTAGPLMFPDDVTAAHYLNILT